MSEPLPWPMELLTPLRKIVGHTQNQEPEIMEIACEHAAAIKQGLVGYGVPVGMRLIVLSLMLLDAVEEIEQKMAADSKVQ
jgi:hypothetical protein